MPDELNTLRNQLGDLRVLAAQITERQQTATDERRRIFQILDGHEAWIQGRREALREQSGITSGRSWAFGKVLAALSVLGTIIATCGGVVMWVLEKLFGGS